EAAHVGHARVGRRPHRCAVARRELACPDVRVLITGAHRRAHDQRTVGAACDRARDVVAVELAGDLDGPAVAAIAAVQLLDPQILVGVALQRADHDDLAGLVEADGLREVLPAAVEGSLPQLGPIRAKARDPGVEGRVLDAADSHELTVGRHVDVVRGVGLAVELHLGLLPHPRARRLAIAVARTAIAIAVTRVAVTITIAVTGIAVTITRSAGRFAPARRRARVVAARGRERDHEQRPGGDTPTRHCTPPDLSQRVTLEDGIECTPASDCHSMLASTSSVSPGTSAIT